MTDRKTASTINDTDLDQLYDQLDALRQVARGYCPTCGRGDAAPTVQDWEQQRERADQAEAAITRVRELQQWARRTYPGLTNLHDRFAAALDQPTPPATTQTTDPAQRGQAVVDGWIQIIDYAHGEEQPHA